MSWTPPVAVTDTPVLFYRIVLKYATNGNGYKTSNPELLDLHTELIDAIAGTRMEIPATQLHATLSGCYSAGISNHHCISPWTFYRVLVSPVYAGYVGRSQAVTVATKPSTLGAPRNTTQLSATPSSIVVSWMYPNPMTAPVASFTLTVTDMTGSVVQTISVLSQVSVQDIVDNPDLVVSHTIANLAPYCSYQVAAIAISDEGTPGLTSNQATVSTTEAVPQQLNPVIVYTRDEGKELKWTAPTPLPGIILRYELCADCSSDATNPPLIYSGTDVTVSFSNNDNTALASSYRVRAVTSAGTGPWSDASTEAAQSTGISATDPIVYGPAVATVILISVLVVLAVYWYRRKIAIDEDAFVRPPADEWERDISTITAGVKLGEGAFGVVMTGTAVDIQPDLPKTTHVAIKMCADDATNDDKRQFVAEMELMKKFSKPFHPNVSKAVDFLYFFLGVRFLLISTCRLFVYWVCVPKVKS